MRDGIIHIDKLNLQEKIVYKTIVESNEFDYEFYCKFYNICNFDPIIHYIKIGVYLGFNPNLNFDTKFYLNNNPELLEKKINPFFHYIKYGRDECKIPKPLTDDEIKKFGFKSKQEVLDFLIILNSKLFDYDFYQNTYDVNKQINAVAHYINIGASRGFNPTPFFDTKYYRNIISNSKMNPFAHYLKFGRFKNILPKKYTLEELLNLNLKKTIKGKNDFIFLINDVTSELRQHFDKSYQNKFNVNEFLEEYYFKKLLFSKNNIDYYYFAIPDKSLVCKEFLPFEVNYIKRNVDKVDEIIDFIDYLNNGCYYKTDNHINNRGGEILSYQMLNYMDNNFTMKDWNELMNQDVKDMKTQKDPELFSEMNWSFSDKERRTLKEKYSEYFEYYVKPINAKDVRFDFPDFILNNERPTYFTENPDSFTDKKILIFRDSAFSVFKWYFSFYFNKMCLYWDHGSLDERIIKFYNPDIIIEVRTERLIDALYKSDWVKNKKNIFQ